MLKLIVKILLISSIYSTLLLTPLVYAAETELAPAVAPATTPAKDVKSEGLPNFDCTLTDTLDGDKPGAASDTFTPTTKMIYLMCETEDVKKGDVTKAVWYATDTNNAAPANYKIDEAEVSVDANLVDGQVWNSKFSLSKPDTGWPVGQYRVELYVSDVLVDTFKFTIK